MDSGSVFIVHSLRHAMAAAATARAEHRTVTLCSAPGAAGYAGVGWFQAILAETRRAYPDVEITGMLDCGDDTAIALEALHAGTTRILFHGSAAALDQVGDVAARLGAAVNSPLRVVVDMRETDPAPHAFRPGPADGLP